MFIRIEGEDKVKIFSIVSYYLKIIDSSANSFAYQREIPAPIRTTIRKISSHSILKKFKVCLSYNKCIL